MLNSRFGYSMKKNSFKGLNIDCIQYSNIIRITYYSYSYSGTILNPNIIRIRIRPNICARILFVFVFAHSEKHEYYLYSYSVKILIPNNIRIRIRSKKQYSLTSVLYHGVFRLMFDIWRKEYSYSFHLQSNLIYQSISSSMHLLNIPEKQRPMV